MVVGASTGGDEVVHTSLGDESMRTIAMIACCKEKLYAPGDGSAAVSEMYTGQLFKVQLAYARQSLPDTQIYILSAKYGLVGLGQLIESYEQTLNKMNMGQRLTWAWGVDEALAIHCPEVKTVWMMAGQAYRENLVELLERKGIEVLRPHPASLGYGQQVQWYMKQVEGKETR